MLLFLFLWPFFAFVNVLTGIVTVTLMLKRLFIGLLSFMNTPLTKPVDIFVLSEACSNDNFGRSVLQ